MSNYKGKTSKSNSKFRSKGQKSFHKDEKFSNDRSNSGNDPQWYGMDPALLRDSASIPYSWAVGTPINRNNPLLDAVGENQYYGIPGVATMYIAPSVGYSTDPASPINVAAANLYANLRKTNSGYSNYNAPDLMLYLLALDQMYSFINFAQRAYGLARLYAQKNRYLPNALLESNRIDGEDLQANLANFRYRLNALINKVASFSVPAILPIFKRHAFMYSNVYVEGVSMKDQLYQFVPHSFWKFTLDEDTSAGKLTPVVYAEIGSTRLYSANELIDFGESLISTIFTNEDFNIMSGDIRKSYGEDVVKLASIPEEYVIIPQYDVAVLEQFKNAVVLNLTEPNVVLEGMDIHQDPSDVHTLVHTPRLQISTAGDDPAMLASAIAAGPYLQSKLITTKAAEPSPELTMENTRLAVVGMDHNESETATTIELHGGSDIAVHCTLKSIEVDRYGNIISYPAYSVAYAEHFSTGWSADLITFNFNRYGYRSAFEFVPETCITVINPDGDFRGSTPLFQVDNYAIVHTDTMDRMHEAALLSLFHVPANSRV